MFLNPKDCKVLFEGGEGGGGALPPPKCEKKRSILTGPAMGGVLPIGRWGGRDPTPPKRDENDRFRSCTSHRKGGRDPTPPKMNEKDQFKSFFVPAKGGGTSHRKVGRGSPPFPTLPRFPPSPFPGGSLRAGGVQS